MLGVVELRRVRPQAAILVVMAVGIAGCSSESTRLGDNPFSSRSGPGPTTGSVVSQAAPTSRIDNSPLPPPPGASRPGDAAAGYRGPGAAPEITGSVRTPPTASGQWSWDGGTAITVAPGDTVEAIAQRHRVPASAIMQANGMASAAIRPGQRLVIPRYTATARSAASAPAGAVAENSSGVHVVAPGETLSKISHRYGKTIPEVAKANNMEPHATLKIGDRIIIPGLRTSSPADKSEPKRAQAQPPALQAAKAPPAAKQSEPSQRAAVMAPATDTPEPPTAAGKTTDATPTFRWPAKGRVIAGFGPKPNGQQNDGINLAVPEGTPIKAAEDGVVAYAGSELKGYGNLVLIRHANGYVTAYAHAKELSVKRGDQIKRGQVVGKAGQTGNVDAPQLHFEVRKGPTPLDPMPLLSGG
jgi:murein DD-endopeptidase MepM/ murein hydrolase activator NlpD